MDLDDVALLTAVWYLDTIEMLNGLFGRERAFRYRGFFDGSKNRKDCDDERDFDTLSRPENKSRNNIRSHLSRVSDKLLLCDINECQNFIRTSSTACKKLWAVMYGRSSYIIIV
jgi:hypothetical protein